MTGERNRGAQSAPKPFGAKLETKGISDAAKDRNQFSVTGHDSDNRRLLFADYHPRARGSDRAGLGAGAGAIIGSTVGHAAVGALIGGPVGLVAGALIGDQLMGWSGPGRTNRFRASRTSKRSNGYAVKTSV